MKRTLIEIKEILLKHKEELRQAYKIEEIGIFGSYVRNDQNVLSDLDILVKFNKDARISLLDFIHLENYLGDLLGLKVDLVERDALKPGIGEYILQEVNYL